jgi:hypothetical protein
MVVDILLAFRRAALWGLGADRGVWPMCALGLPVMRLVGLFDSGIRTAMAIQLKIGRLRSLLVGLGRGSLRFPFGDFFCIDLRPPLPLTLMGVLMVERARFAINTGMGKVLSVRVLDIMGVETFDVLPGIACFAVYRVPVIVSKTADTLDGVRFFLDRLGLAGDMV